MSNERIDDYRRANRFGARKALKRLLGVRPFNDAARMLIRAAGGGGRWSSFPVNLPEVEGSVDGGRFTLLEPMRCSIAREIYWGGGRRLVGRERFALELFCRLGKDARLALDIGANTGIFSLALASVNPKVEIHAYEIVPEVFELLRANTVRNRAAGRIACHDYGLGEDGKTIRLPETTEAGSLPLGFSSRWDSPEGRAVAFRSLDAVLPEFAGKKGPVVSKIDVETTEDELFRHGEKFLAAFSPDFVCEILPSAADPAFIDAALRRHGYSLYKIGDGELIAAGRVAPDREHPDWLFTKRPKEALP
jgi:FkbM family methyltransferase